MNATDDDLAIIEEKLVTLRQIAQRSPVLRRRVDDALGQAVSTVLTSEKLPRTTFDVVKALLRVRARRSKVFRTSIFKDPAWDMLLDLYAGREVGRETSVSSLCIAAGVPATTGLRYISAMEKLGYIHRRRDARDHRRIIVDADPIAMEGVEMIVGSLVESL